VPWIRRFSHVAALVVAVLVLVLPAAAAAAGLSSAL
jgi:hypothetical protein